MNITEGEEPTPRGLGDTSPFGRDPDRSPGKDEPASVGAVGRHEAAYTRHETVARAVSKWVTQLVDLTGRNRLLYYRNLRRGSLDLSKSDDVAINALLAGRSVKLSRLLPPTQDEPERTEEALANARTIYRKARTLFEERGIETLFIAVGLVQWTTDATSATPSAPLFMAHMDLAPTGSGETDYNLVVRGDWLVNDTLVLFLRETFAAALNVEQLLEIFDPAHGPGEAFGAFIRQADTVPDISIAERVVIGTFQYTKLPMVRDLEQHIDELTENDIVAAIAGDDTAREAVRSKRVDVDPSLPNEIPPSDEFLVLDADSSQNRAINAALAGESLVIQGPPGTGKSQTIANLIATLTARGKRVLFVAEKRAAIDAVTKRLNAVGLGETVMDLHGGVSSRRELAARLAASLDAIKSVPVSANPDRDFRLVSSRNALLDYTEALHAIREPYGISVYEAYVRLSGVTALDSDLLTPTQLNDLDVASMRIARQYLSEWMALNAPFRAKVSPWTGAEVSTPSQAADALDAARDVSAVAANVASDLDSILRETGLSEPRAIDQWNHVIECLQLIRATLAVAAPTIFEIPSGELGSASEALAPGHRPWIGRAWASAFDSSYREAARRLRPHWLGKSKPNGRQAIRLVETTLKAVDKWSELGGKGSPRLPTMLTEREEGLRDLERRLAVGSHVEVDDSQTPLRGKRPWFRPGLPIVEYSHAQLVSIAKWIMSDTLLRTRDELVREMMRVLGFQKRGSRIVQGLDRAADEALR